MNEISKLFIKYIIMERIKNIFISTICHSNDIVLYV